jgi:hypothetical protein
MKKHPLKIKSKLIIGWREWCSLPELGLPGIAAKIDTGAKTSSLHAFNIETFSRDNKAWLRFCIHPIQRHRYPEIQCEAKMSDQRLVTSSNGAVENRFVINTTLTLGAFSFTTDVTLTNRDEMGFRMLIGRQSLSQRFVVDPCLSYTTGDYDEEFLYPGHIKNRESL